MDAQPPAIVWEGHGACTRSDHSESLLRRGLASSMAPGAMWVVNVHLEATGPHQVTAESEITDNDGMTVAHRSLVGADCDGLARATGVWASLVLESEIAGMTQGGDDAKNAAAAEPVEADTRDATPWPAPAPLEQPSPEHDLFLRHAEDRNLEVGMAGFLMTGAGGMAMGGVSPFLIVETGYGLYVRPSLVVGESLGSVTAKVDARAQVAATRFDGCMRMPGLYQRHRGMQLDVCAGADVGLTTIDGVPPGNPGAPGARVTSGYLSMGPSIALRGELGSALSATLRGLAGANLFSMSFYDSTGAYIPPLPWSGRVEVALSWGLR